MVFCFFMISSSTSYTNTKIDGGWHTKQIPTINCFSIIQFHAKTNSCIQHMFSYLFVIMFFIMFIQYNIDRKWWEDIELAKRHGSMWLPLYQKCGKALGKRKHLCRSTLSGVRLHLLAQKILHLGISAQCVLWVIFVVWCRWWMLKHRYRQSE